MWRTYPADRDSDSGPAASADAGGSVHAAGKASAGLGVVLQ